MQNEFFLGAANFSFCFDFQGSFRDAQEFVCCFALEKLVQLLPCRHCVATPLPRLGKI